MRNPLLLSIIILFSQLHTFAQFSATETFSFGRLTANRGNTHPDIDLFLVDVDQDGDLDLYESSGQIMENINSASGIWKYHKSNINSRVTNRASNVHFADFNSDNFLDILSQTDAGFKIAYGDGTFNYNFSMDNNFVYPYTNVLDVLDFNMDGYVDVIIDAFFDDVVYVMFNDGQDNFTNSNIDTLFLGSVGGIDNPLNNTVIMDMDDDGDNDVLVTTNNAVILCRNELGVFNLDTIFNNNARSNFLITDFNGDGDLDIYFAQDDGELVIASNINNTSYSITTNSTNRFGNYLDLLDFDGDGDNDIVSVHSQLFSGNNNGSVYIIENLGSGNFSNTQNMLYQNFGGDQSVDGKDVLIDDFDNDGYDDVLIAAEDSYPAGNYIVFTYNGGASGLNVKQYPISNGYQAEDMLELIVDINNDGALDIVSESDIGYWLLNHNDDNFSYETFDRNGILNSSLGNVTTINFLDFDQDDFPDLIRRSYAFNDYKVLIYKNFNGEYFDSLATLELPTNDKPYFLRVADFNSDGLEDIVSTSNEGDSGIKLDIYYNLGNGEFQYELITLPLVTSNFINNLKLEDIDNDGLIDVFIYLVSQFSGAWTLFKQASLGIFSNQIPLNIGHSAGGDFAIIDIDNDGLKDFVYSSSSTNVTSKLYYVKQADNGTFGNNVLLATGSVNLKVINFALGDLDLDGDIDIIYDNTNSNQLNIITVLLNNGSGIFEYSDFIPTIYSNPKELILKDFDNDNDLDLFITGNNMLQDYNNYIAYYENELLDGTSLIGRAYADENFNGVWDSTEQFISNMNLIQSPNENRLVSNREGNFRLNNLFQNNLFVSKGSGFYQPSLDSIQHLDLPVNLDTILYFGFVPMLDTLLLKTYIFGDHPRCNELVKHYAIVSNNGTVSTTGNFEIIIPDALGVSQILPIPDSSYVIDDTTYIYWALDTLHPNDHFQFSFFKLIPEFVSDGDTYELSSKVNNYDPNNQHLEVFYTYRTFIRCAFDPNDKQVNPIGIGEDNYTLLTDELTYIIRFQNTGNDVAFNVNIIDEIDINLDLATFRLIESSHDLDIIVNESNRTINFIFENIMLPDSSTDLEGSQGYVVFRIYPRNGVESGTVVSNLAQIFFDSNPAIITNSTTNTLVDELPDLMNPSAICNNTVNIYLNENGTASLNINQINLGSYDNNEISNMEISKTEFNCEDLGFEVVNLFVFDAAGNSDVCSSNIQVLDTISPSIACLDINLEITEGEVLSIIDYINNFSTSDNCSGSIIKNADKSNFNILDLGDNAVTISIEDESGNTNTCIINVNVTLITNVIESLYGITAVISPNPMNDYALLNFSKDLPFNFDVEVMNTNGQIVRKYKNKSGRQVKIEKGDLSSGLFIIAIKNLDTNNVVANYKLIIE